MSSLNRGYYFNPIFFSPITVNHKNEQTITLTMSKSRKLTIGQKDMNVLFITSFGVIGIRINLELDDENQISKQLIAEIGLDRSNIITTKGVEQLVYSAMSARPNVDCTLVETMVKWIMKNSTDNYETRNFISSSVARSSIIRTQLFAKMLFYNLSAKLVHSQIRYCVQKYRFKLLEMWIQQIDHETVFLGIIFGNVSYTVQQYRSEVELLL
ncbi:hypothetical protein BDF20DRAFT_837814 [Mycotypha africana]|uniref:uncharacterized protein n=1 Tax=Mycotypha africana TaxID=64632 RepID=UPI0023011E3C|nr:uncharacterized protein BDF20DRAFT_837814 [Mycotypha africana]KAI8971489.1 hypothetical protein BDF20DRAFT_837814 [Mycotypha africana]